MISVFADPIVDWSRLGQAVLVSVVAGLAILLIAGIAVVTSLRAQDERVEGHGNTAVTAYFAVTVLCVLALAAAIGAGIWIMTQ